MRHNFKQHKPENIHNTYEPAHWGIDAIMNLVNITKGSGVKVAVLDKALDIEHRDLTIDCSNYRDFVVENGGSSPTDEDKEHGTFVSGIIGANGTMQGVAPECELIVARVIGDGIQESVVIEALQWAVEEMGAKIVNMSFHIDKCYPEFHQLIKNYTAERNIIFVAEAGNSPNKEDNISFPAAYQEVLAIGSIDQGGTIAQGSRGKILDLLAPGHRVTSLAPNQSYTNHPGGASFAAAYVSGVIALLNHLCDKKNIKLNLYMIKKLLIASVKDVNELGIDWFSGYGIINPNELISKFDFYLELVEVSGDNLLAVIRDKMTELLEEPNNNMSFKDLLEQDFIQLTYNPNP